MKVYLIKTVELHPKYKIGFTKRDVSERIKEFKTGNSLNFEIIKIFESKWSSKIERSLHKKYVNNKICGEWFDLKENDINNFISDCDKIHNMYDIISNQNTWIIDNKIFK